MTEVIIYIVSKIYIQTPAKEPNYPTLYLYLHSKFMKQPKTNALPFI